MKPLQIGKLKYRVQLQTLNEAETGASDIQSTWTTSITLWAYIEQLKGLTYLDMRQIGQEVTHKITIRSHAITAESFILYKSRRFRIRSVTDDGRFCELLCQEIQNDIT